MISVIIPLYNKEKSIKQTITSVLNQSFKDFELIIVNDGSTDNSLEIVNSIQDERILILNKLNGGVSSARNEGIKAAKNEYIALLDGDDIWHIDHLKIIFDSFQSLDNDDIGGIGTSFYKSNSRSFDESKYRPEVPYKVKDYFQFMSSPKARFNSSTLVVKKSKVMETGLFDINLKYGEDVEFWYKLFSKYNLIYINSITAIYFIAAENRSEHYVMPLEKRFHIFNYKDKSSTEKRYLDKLVALILLNYFKQNAFKEVGIILKKYYLRIGGIFGYYLSLISKKIFN